MPNFIERWGPAIWRACQQTLQMVSISFIFAILIGMPLAVILVMTRKKSRGVYLCLSTLINIIRSVPFIILLFFILPFTRLVVGTSIGVRGVIVPLVIYTSPYIARLMESALLEVDKGVIEAYQAMGISTRNIIWHVLIREARPAITLGLTIALIGLIGATAMAGLVGAGGLGDLAYRFGHLRYEVSVMNITVLILIILVQGVQTLGNYVAERLKKD